MPLMELLDCTGFKTRNLRLRTETYILPYVEHDQWSKSQCSGLTQRYGVGEGGGRGFGWGYTCASVANSCWGMAKTITILESNNPPIKINNFFKKDISTKTSENTKQGQHRLSRKRKTESQRNLGKLQRV